MKSPLRQARQPNNHRKYGGDRDEDSQPLDEARVGTVHPDSGSLTARAVSMSPTGKDIGCLI